MIDRYTKIVLTVIAGALLVLVAQNATHGAMAQTDEPQKVQICDSTFDCASLSPIVRSWGGTSATTYGLTVVPPTSP